MPSQNGNGGRGGPWGSGATSGSNFEDLVRQGQDRLKQIMPSGGPRGVIVLAVLALVGLARIIHQPSPYGGHGSVGRGWRTGSAPRVAQPRE